MFLTWVLVVPPGHVPKWHTVWLGHPKILRNELKFQVSGPAKGKAKQCTNCQSGDSLALGIAAMRYNGFCAGPS
jgi:hypothetical protein